MTTTETRFYQGDLVTVDSAADGVFDAVVERPDGIVSIRGSEGGS